MGSTAIACLNHHIVHLGYNRDLESNKLGETRHASEQVSDSLRDITRNFIELKKRNLAKYLPNTL